MPIQGLAQKALCGWQIAMLAGPEVHGVADAIDSAAQVHPSAVNLGFVHTPDACQSSLAPVETLLQQQREAPGPAIDRRVINGHAALSHHPFQITQTEIVSQIPANAEQDDRLIEVAAFEHEASPDLRATHANRPLQKSLRQNPFETCRRVVLGAGMIGVHGRIQREPDIVHLVTHRLTDLLAKSASIRDRDAAFPLPQGRGDEFHHGSPTPIRVGC